VLLRLSFRLNEKVGLMLNIFLVLDLLVKVNEVFGGAAIMGPMPLCSASTTIALLFPTVVICFLLGVEPTFGLSLSFDLDHGTPLPLPLSLSTAPLAVARTLSNIIMCFRHNYGTSRPGKMIVYENLILLLGNR